LNYSGKADANVLLELSHFLQRRYLFVAARKQKEQIHRSSNADPFKQRGARMPNARKSKDGIR
jgi:hypothetical protein